MTGSVDIKDLSPVTRHTLVTIHFAVVRAAVACGISPITQNGAATVTLLSPVQTLRATFEIVCATVVTIILIDHRAVTRLGGGCHRSD